MRTAFSLMVIPRSRSMILSGLLVLAFIVYHLLHFTVQVTNAEYRQFYEYQGRPVTLVNYEPAPQLGPSQAEADARLADLQVQVTQTGDTIRVVVVQPEEVTLIGSNRSDYVDFTVLVPAQTRVTVDTGTADIFGPISMLLPVRRNGVMCASKFSVQASHFSSGEIAKSVANAEMACCR